MASDPGIYFTPPALANRLLDQAEAAGVDWTRAHILDPAAGAGGFLVPVAERMLTALSDCTAAIAIQNLNARMKGYELQPFAAWLCQVFIEATALSWIIESGRRPLELISVRDSLSADMPGGQFDLVVGNPPFGRVALSNAQRVRFSRSLYGHANLYGVFLDLAVRLTRPDGLVSFLTPSSFLAGEYFKNLRALLWREAPPVMLDLVTLRRGVFENVLQETVLATYRKDSHRASIAVSFIQPAMDGQEVAIEAAGRCVLPEQACAPWVLPRHADQTRLAKGIQLMPARLADWGYAVSTGPLVWNRFKTQLRDTPETGTVPLVWAECITNDGRFVFRSKKRNHKPYFMLKEKDDWLVVRTACVLLQRTTAKEQARRLIAAEMPTSFVNSRHGVTVENHVNMLIPIGSRPHISPALLASFLNTTAADRAFRCISGSVAVSAYELENLPLPDPAQLKRRLRQRTDRAVVERVSTDIYVGASYE